MINRVKELNDLLDLGYNTFLRVQKRNCTNDQPRLPELTRAKSAVQTSEISTEPPFLLIKSIIGYININCKKAYTVLYTIYMTCQ
jgi:hypothetical protein